MKSYTVKLTMNVDTLDIADKAILEEIIKSVLRTHLDVKAIYVSILEHQ